MIDNAELIVYSGTGETFTLPLSEAQLYAVVRILGISEIKENGVTCYSDEAVLRLANRFTVID